MVNRSEALKLLVRQVLWFSCRLLLSLLWWSFALLAIVWELMVVCFDGLIEFGVVLMEVSLRHFYFNFLPSIFSKLLCR